MGGDGVGIANVIYVDICFHMTTSVCYLCCFMYVCPSAVCLPVRCVLLFSCFSLCSFLSSTCMRLCVVKRYVCFNVSIQSAVILRSSS